MQNCCCIADSPKKNKIKCMKKIKNGQRCFEYYIPVQHIKTNQFEAHILNSSNIIHCSEFYVTKINTTPPIMKTPNLHC